MKQIVTPSLEEAKKRISNWRATRTKRWPIPDEVWDAVLPLISQHSYSNISRELGLSYLQIRNKIEMDGSNNPLALCWKIMGNIGELAFAMLYAMTFNDFKIDYFVAR